MKSKTTVLLLISLLMGVVASGQKDLWGAPAPFKVVGYYFLEAAQNNTSPVDSSYGFLDKLTHVNLAFFNPDSAGYFKQDLAIDSLIAGAHRRKVKVLASIGGGGQHPYYAWLLQEKDRTRFIGNLVALVQRYALDGIDVDLEGSDIGSHYQSFVTELAALLKPQGKLLTAAIATAYKDQFADEALRQFDFVNIMSYDRTGPWRPSDPGHHAPFEMAVQDLHYWHQVRGIPREKIVLGLPFYGYGFGGAGAPVISMNYKEVVSAFPTAQSDTLRMPGNVVFYYNHVSTIENKTRLALQQAGGVMIWQLLGDAPGERSLLKAIHHLIYNHQNNKTQGPL